MTSDSPYRPPESNVAGGGADDTDALERAFIGPKNTEYYLRAFKKLESGQGSAAWHWPSFFMTLFWLGYRRIWVWFFVYWFFFPIALVVVAAILAMINESFGAIFYFLGLFLIPPLFANRLYYKHAKNMIAQARGASSDPQQQLLQAARTGGTSSIAIFVFIFLAIGMAGVMAAIAIPAYQDYTIRAQVSEGLNLSGGAKAAVVDYYLESGYAPVDNDEAGLAEPESISGDYTHSVAIVDGDVIVTYGRSAHQLLHGKTLLLVPSDDDGAVAWACGSNTIEEKHLPAACRNAIIE